MLCSVQFTVAQAIDIELDNDDIALGLVLLELERKYGFLFSYKESDLPQYKLTIPRNNLPIQAFLTEILAETNLEFEIVDEKYILLTPKNKNGNEKIGTTENDLSTHDICGFIYDKRTQIPLSFANVYQKNSEKGTFTDENGSFNFNINQYPKDSLIISYIGYKERILSVEYFSKDCPIIELESTEFNEDFIVVVDYLTDGIKLENNNASTILEPDKIGALPGQVEPDILGTIQFLPGISSPNNTAGGISIRGGTPDQNLTLWEDIPMYHSAHYFGLISAFNPYIVDEVAVYRGGFDAEYGGRISGVIDLKSKEVTNKSSFGMGINLLNGYANAAVPLLKNKASIILSARHSLPNAWKTPTYENLSRRIHRSVLLQNVRSGKIPQGIEISDQFSFLDTNIKFSYQPTAKDQISIAGFYGNNDFKSDINNTDFQIKQADTLYLDNQGFSVSWTHQWTPNFKSKILTVDTEYSYNYQYNEIFENRPQPDRAGTKNNAIKEQQLHFINTYEDQFSNTYKLGYIFTNYDIDYEITRFNRQQNLVNEIRSLNSDVQVMYGSFSTAEHRKIGGELGLRGSYFQQNQQYYAEPRLRLWYKPTNYLNFYVNAGRYYQFLSQLIEIKQDQASIGIPVWVIVASKEVPVLSSNQIQIGGVYSKKTWLVDVQIYRRNMNGLSSLSNGFDESNSNQFFIGSARINGVDILIKKRWRNYRSWISYSYSEVEHQFDQFFDSIFRADNDQPHALNWVHQWSINNWDIALGWQITSGTPYSNLDNFQINLAMPNMGMPIEIIVPTTDEFNDERLPNLHRLDASVTYTIRSKKEKNWKGIIGLSLNNIYNQKNIYDRNIYIERMPQTTPRISYSDQLDLGFTPNLVLRWEW